MTDNAAAVPLAYRCYPAPREVGYWTEIDGMLIQTRFTWDAFDKEWQEGLLAYARSEYELAARLGKTVERISIDHISLARKSFYPEISYKGL
jgi:hypothetical protein